MGAAYTGSLGIARRSPRRTDEKLSSRGRPIRGNEGGGRAGRRGAEANRIVVASVVEWREWPKKR